MSSILTLLLALLQLSWAANKQEEIEAGIDGHAKAAYFVLASSGYVFALNVAANGDIYYHMNAPASHSWMGVGFGHDMRNTRMLIAYVSADGHHLTNTARMAKGHSEPEWESDIIIEGVYNDTYAPYSNTLSPDGIMITHAVCRNCSSWAGGSIDTTSTTQPFIFALGPNATLHSDDPNAALRIHEFHGNFQLDMTVATNSSGAYGRVPAPQDPGLQVGDSFWAFANYFSSNTYNTGTDAEWAGIVHAVFMCLAFLLVFPLGAVLLRLMRRVMVHAAIQAVGVGLVVIGVGLGVYASRMYNKVSRKESALVLRQEPNESAVKRLQFGTPDYRLDSIRRCFDPSWTGYEPSLGLHESRYTHCHGQDTSLPRNLHRDTRDHQRRYWARLRGKFDNPLRRGSCHHAPYLDSNCCRNILQQPKTSVQAREASFRIKRYWLRTARRV